MTITTYTPAVQVLLTKMVARVKGVASRYAATPRQIDITPYLGDAGAIRTVKSILEPAGGFSISFADATDPTIEDSLYALIEPQDMVEIRSSRTPFKYAGQKLPLIMRGLVSSIRRTEGIGPDGKPRRLVVVQGQDFGKLWMINQVYFESAIVTDKPYIDQFQLNVTIGLLPSLMPANNYMTFLAEKVMNEKISMMAHFSSQVVKPFMVDASVPDGQVFPQQGGSFSGRTMWDLASMFADRPWNELFIEDHEDGPHLVFRPTPYYDINGKLIIHGAVDPGVIEMDISAVVNLDLMRSDARVANFYWVPPGTGMLDTTFISNVSSLYSSQLDLKYGNDSPELYGIRKMVCDTRLLPNNPDSLPSMLPPSEQAPANGDIVLWYQQRAIQLRDMNRDNSVFEEGSATVMGSEDLKAGRYLRVTRGDLVSRNYITRVAHTIVPLRTWTADLTLIRGDGFLGRIDYAGSPAAAEGRKGPYSA